MSHVLTRRDPFHCLRPGVLAVGWGAGLTRHVGSLAQPPWELAWVSPPPCCCLWGALLSSDRLVASPSSQVLLPKTL